MIDNSIVYDHAYIETLYKSGTDGRTSKTLLAAEQ